MNENANPKNILQPELNWTTSAVKHSIADSTSTWDSLKRCGPMYRKRLFLMRHFSDVTPSATYPFIAKAPDSSGSDAIFFDVV